VAVGVVAALVIVGGGGYVGYRYLTRDDVAVTTPAATASPAPTSASAAPSGTAPSPTGQTSSAGPGTPTAPAPTSAASVDPQATALATLEAERAQARAGLSLDGRWVAQVASKSVGIVDPLQTTADGRHDFQAVDILAEAQGLQARFAPTPTLLLSGADFGRNTPGRSALWITVVDGGFGSKEGVRAWCDGAFAELSAAARANQCAPRQLKPPS